jgi:hypothetical protein
MKIIAPALRILALSVLVGGCAHNPSSDPFDPGARPIRLDVVNRNFNDASIWAVYPGERIKLGMVTGKTESTFQLPWKAAEPVHMEIDLVGGERCATETLTVDQGDVLYLEIHLEFATMRDCHRI